MWVELEGLRIHKKTVKVNYFNKQTAFIQHQISSVTLTGCRRFITFRSCLRPWEGEGEGNAIFLQWKFASLFRDKVVKIISIVN